MKHKNGIPSDNRLENLTFLCPNCHSQTEAYSGKSKKVKNRIGGERIKIAQDWARAKAKGGDCLSEEYESAQKKMKWKCSNDWQKNEQLMYFYLSSITFNYMALNSITKKSLLTKIGDVILVN